MSGIYKGDVGTIISLNTGVVISGATALSIEALKPSGAKVSWSGIIGDDTKSVEHVITAGELDEAGDYIVQAKLTLGSGIWRGASVTLKILDAFK